MRTVRRGKPGKGVQITLITGHWSQLFDHGLCMFHARYAAIWPCRSAFEATGIRFRPSTAEAVSTPLINAIGARISTVGSQPA
jgi:hypothetical protein